jgi:hypothetical protein
MCWSETTDQLRTTTAELSAHQRSTVDASEQWFTLNNGHGPISGSRGREFKSRQPDSKAPSESTFPRQEECSAWLRTSGRFTFISDFQMPSLEQPREHAQRTVHPARKAQIGADADPTVCPSGGAASTGATPARSMATAEVWRTRCRWITRNPACWDSLQNLSVNSFGRTGLPSGSTSTSPVSWIPPKARASLSAA